MISPPISFEADGLRGNWIPVASVGLMTPAMTALATSRKGGTAGAGRWDQMLDDLNILVVEDEALVAVDLSMMLEDEGARVVGPCMSVGDALAYGAPVDAAVLDVDLRGEAVFPVADRLSREGKPFMFHTGRANLDELRARYGHAVPIVTKPSSPEEIVRTLTGAIAGTA